MKSKLTDNIIITLVVLSMLFLSVISLFLFTKDSTYAVDINNQNNQTNSAYVTFDVGFENASKQIEHSIVADVNPEYKYLHIVMGLAQNCTLINPKVQFYDSANGSNINFNLGAGFGKMTGQYIKSTNETYKYIQFEDLTQGLNYRFDMSTIIGKEVNLSKLNETSKAVFTATLRDPNGNTTAVSKEIYFNVGWTANLSMSMSQTVEKFAHTKVGTEDNLVVETELIAKINSSGKYNILPVKQTQIVIDVPTYKGIVPKSVTVAAKRTGATNGKTGSDVIFNNSNWNYNASTQKLTIIVNNEVVGGKVVSSRDFDEYHITYTYPQAAYDVVDTSGVNITNKVSGTMELYSNTSTTRITGNINSTLRLTDYVTPNTNGTISKSPMYFNTLKTYTREIPTMFILTYKSRQRVEGSKTKVVFEQLKFKTGEAAEYNSFIDGINYAPITKFQIPVNYFNEYFGNTGTGTIEIYEDDRNLIGTITSSTAVQTINGENYYVFTIPTDVRKRAEKISLVASTPINELAEIRIEIYREISKDLPYTIKQLQSFKQTYEAMKNYHTNGVDNTNFIYEENNDLTLTNDLTDTYSNAEIMMTTTNLKAEPGEQTLKFDIILDNSHFDTDVWSEPYFDIVLPEYVTGLGGTLNTNSNMNISDSVYFGAYFYTKKIGNNWHLLLPLQGTHKAVFDKQTKLTVEIGVYVDKFATNCSKEVQMYYINKLASSYKNPSTWQVTPESTGENVKFPVLDNGTACGIATTELNFVADPNLLCVSEISEYSGSNSINSIDNKDTAAEIDRIGGINPKMTLIVQNNHTVPVSNATLLGRIPTTNNKYAITNTDLGTTIDTTLLSLLTTTSGKNITIYYSDNLDATKDISLASNNWVTNPANLATVKSYLIVIQDELAPGEQLRFTYNFAVPNNLYYNKALYTNFGAYYTAGDTDRTSEAAKIGLATNRGPIFRLSKVATIANGSATVKEGDIITYKLTIENNGEIAANNVIIRDSIPANTTYVELNEEGEYVEDPTKIGVTYNIDTLPARGSIIYTFSVKVNEITENTTIQNTADVEAIGVEKVSSNTTETPAIPTKPNLAITKTSDIVDGATVGEGDKINYTITVVNNGDGNAKNVVIKDNIPEHTNYFNTETNTIDTEKTEVESETKAILKPGETFTFTFTVAVNAVTENTMIQNTAKVKADNNEEITSNTVNINAIPKVPNIEITKTSDIAEGISVKEGDIITYTITVRNKGNGVAKNVIITDTIPENTIYYDTVTNTAKEDIKVINSSVRERLEPGEGFSFTFKVQVGRIDLNKTIQNMASVKGDNFDEVSSNTVGIEASITKPSLRATKTASISEGTVVKEGTVITYTITVQNVGSKPAYDVTIKDTVPEYTTYYEDDTRKSEIKNVGKNIEKLEPGQSESYTFSVIVDDITENLIIENIAKVNAENGEETPSNAVNINAVPKEANLEVIKTSDIMAETTVKEGDFITYTVRVRNIGDGVARNIIIKDTIPESTVYYDETTNSVNPAIKSINSETKDILNPNEIFSFTFKVQVGRISTNKVIQNIAKVQNDKGEVGSNTVNINAVITKPNLRIEKTSSVTPETTIKAGSTITYTIMVQNIGTSPAYDVAIRDIIPEHTIYYENNTKDPSKKNVGKDIAVLNSGQSESYSFTVMVDELTENVRIRNTAKVSAENSEEKSTNTVDIIAEPKVPDLQAIKTSSIIEGNSVKEGDIITYTITVRNIGDGIAKNVKITDTIPEGTFYYNEDTKSVEKEKTVVNSDIKENLLPEETFTYTFKVQVGRVSKNKIINNIAKVTSDNLPDISTNSIDINAVITIPNLKITKTSNITDGTIVKEGDLITYTITVENEGETPAYDVTIKDIVPEHTTLYENGEKNPDKRNVEKTIASIAPGASESYSFTVVVDEITEKGVKIENAATVTSENGEEKPSNKVEINTTPSEPKIKVTKSSNIPTGAVLKEGDIITYTITVENIGTVAAYGVSIKDKVPEHTTYYENNMKDPSKKDVGKDIEVLNPGESESYSFTVMVNEVKGKVKIENTASVTSENGEEKPSNKIDIDVIGKIPNLEVNKTSDIEEGKTVKEGDIITYKITVRNTGNGAAKNVMVKDNIPEGTIYYDTETNTLKPSVKTINSEVKETLEPDESFEFTFKVQVGRVSVGKTITNTATVVGDNVEDTPSNTEGITAEATVPKLRLEKKSSIEEGQVVKEGDTITYTITVYNEGTMPAYDVEIKDKVPEYTTYYENNKKDKEKVEVGKVIPELKAGASESYTFTVIVEEIPENTEIKNTATVKGENGEEVQSDTVGVSAEISVPEMKLEKKSSIEKGKTIESGDIITYTIVATNTGKCIAHNVVISDKIPENTIYVEKMGDKYIKDESKKEITKEIEKLEPGETATLTFNVMVGELSGNVQIRNTAKVNANNDGGGVESNTVGISAKPKDSGKTDGDLPYTGNYPLMIITSVGMIACTVFAIYEYKSLKRRR